MENKIRIYLNGEGLKGEKTIEVQPEVQLEEIIAIFHEEIGAAGSIDDYKLFVEKRTGDEVEIVEEEITIIKHKSRVHCHRCDKVAVSVAYQHLQKVIEVEPSQSIAELTEKACEEFSIQPSDRNNFVLKRGTETLSTNAHIGTFVNYPDCKISLSLAIFDRFLG